MNLEHVDRLIAMALEEDLGSPGDVTSLAIFSGERRSSVLVSKDHGVLAGLSVFARVFERVDPESAVEPHAADGDPLSPGDRVATVRGAAGSLLSAERTALNFLSFLSGIATETHRFVSAAAGRVEVLDTRKTLPAYRDLSKYAVRVGGGRNHRQGLHDMVLIKDNHIDMAGSISLAVERVRRRWAGRYRVEVECRTVDDVAEAVEAGADVIMLDNMSDALILESLRHRKTGVEFEISGNVRLEDVDRLAGLGADFVSVGRITHSAPRFDFSLLTETGRQETGTGGAAGGI